MAFTAKAEKLLALAKKLDANENDTQARNELTAATDAFNLSIQTKGYIHYRDWADMARIRCASALLQHNVIQSIPAKGYITAKELAKSSTMDERMIARLIMNLTVQGIIALHPDDAQSYAHTHISQAWLEYGGPEYTIYFVDQLNLADTGKFFHDRTIADAENPLRCPSVWAENSEGADWFALISKDPARLAGNDTAMTYGDSMLPLFGFYPYEQLADPSFPTDRPLFVDIGGGRGQVLRKFVEKFPSLQNYRFILQERPDVLTTAKDLPANVESMAQDFFQPQKVQGAKFYYLRRILHDWDDDTCVLILKNVVPQMEEDSRILIQEFQLPDRAEPGMEMTPFFYDYTMMMVGGKERREVDYKRLFERAGLEFVKTWTKEGEVVAVFEAKRKMN